MDIVKAQRLSQNLAVVSDMVAYSDIADYLVESGMVDPHENQCLLGKLTGEGNVMVMNELLTMITLRRGGFDALLIALRKSERLDPGKLFSGGGGLTGSVCSTPDGSGRARPAQKNIMTAISRRISRRSGSILSSSSRPRSRGNYGKEEDKDSDAIFMSYRDDCPMDIPINPSYYTNQGQTEKWTEPALESASISETTNDVASGADAFEILNLDGNTATSSSSTMSMTPSRTAVIYNLAPTQLETGQVEEYLTTLAKRANIPSPMIQDLKVLNPVGKISKRKKKQKNKLKIQFNSETGRNAFVQQINHFIQNVKPNDELYESVSHLKVAIPKKKGRRLMFGGVGKAEAETRNWYQKPFRFQKWKK